MIIVNPQWQGIGSKNPVPQGAEIIKKILGDLKYQEIPLDNTDIEVEDNVKGLSQIFTLIKQVNTLLDTKNPEIIFTCGGDCSSDFAQISYMNEKYNGDMTLIWIDAHADLNTPQSSQSKNFHGMPIRSLMGDGHPKITKQVTKFLKPDQLVFFGLRSIDPEEQRFIEEFNIPVYTTKQTGNGNIKDIPLPSKNIYLHVDIDSLDQSIFNDCATPTSGGFSLETLTNLISNIMRDHNVIGGCLTEYGPKTADSQKNIIEKILLEAFDIRQNFML